MVLVKWNDKTVKLHMTLFRTKNKIMFCKPLFMKKAKSVANIIAIFKLLGFVQIVF